MLLSQVVNPGEETRLNGLAGNSTYRTNIGFSNASAAVADLSVDLVDSTGAIIGHHNPTLQPWGWLQLNDVFQDAGFGSVEAASAVIQNQSMTARVFVYASVVDALTGDPTFVTEATTGSIQDDLWITASAHADGVSQSVWRTDLWLTNQEESDLPVTIDLLKRNQDNSTPTSADVSVPAGETVMLGDILATVFNFPGTAALRISLKGEMTVTSRTFNQTDDGTFGQFIPGVTKAAAISEGEIGVLIQLRESGQFRTNVGFVNLQGETLTVRAEYHAGDGTLLKTKEYVLQPFGYFQDGSAFPADSNVDGGFAHLTTSTPEGSFLAYASVIDNKSDDPVFMPARVVGN